MAPIYFLKTVAALPGIIFSNAVYAVRVGAGFDLYISTEDAVAHKLNVATVKTFSNKTEYDAYAPTDPNEIVLYVGT